MVLDIENASIYVDTYAKYNEGLSGGDWVNLSDFDSEEEFMAHILDLHSDEEEPEFMFTDYEEIPSDMISETGLSSEFWELKSYLDGLDEPQAFVEYMDEMGVDVKYAMEHFEDAYAGNQDFGDFAYDMFNISGDIPEHVMGYIDWEKWEQDLGYDYTVTESGYIFRNF